MHLKQHAHKKGRLVLPFVSGLLSLCSAPLKQRNLKKGKPHETDTLSAPFPT